MRTQCSRPPATRSIQRDVLDHGLEHLSGIAGALHPRQGETTHGDSWIRRRQLHRTRHDRRARRHYIIHDDDPAGRPQARLNSEGREMRGQRRSRGATRALVDRRRSLNNRQHIDTEPCADELLTHTSSGPDCVRLREPGSRHGHQHRCTFKIAMNPIAKALRDTLDDEPDHGHTGHRVDSIVLD